MTELDWKTICYQKYGEVGEVCKGMKLPFHWVFLCFPELDGYPKLDDLFSMENAIKLDDN